MQQNLEMAPLLKYKHLMWMSTWRLPILPDEDRDRFNEINNLQQGLLNLLWQVKTKKDKAHALNGLADYSRSMGKIPCIQDNFSVHQERSSKLSDDDHLEEGSSNLSDFLLMPGERFPKLYDQDDPNSKLLNHKVCDSEIRSSEIFRSPPIDTFPQKERKGRRMRCLMLSHLTKDASTQTKSILDDSSHKLPPKVYHH